MSTRPATDVGALAAIIKTCHTLRSSDDTPSRTSGLLENTRAVIVNVINHFAVLL